MDFVAVGGDGPFHPFKAFEIGRFEQGSIGREKTMEFCLRAVEMCDEFWLFGVSLGTIQELCHAQSLNKPIRLVKDFDPEWDKHIKLIPEVVRI